jgi:hypothetical protein
LFTGEAYSSKLRERIEAKRNLWGAQAASLWISAACRNELLLISSKMADEHSAIPLADVLRAANDLVSADLIADYALGGALAAIYYTEPITTYDADIIFIASDSTLSAGIPAIYSHLRSKGWRVQREHLLIKEFPVQFLPASGLTEEAVREAKQIEYEGIPAKVFRPEYIIAIAASVGRHKDFARIEQLMEQTRIDKPLLDDILRRYNLKLPNK